MTRKKCKALQAGPWGLLKQLLRCALLIALGLIGWIYYYATAPRHFAPAFQSILIEPGQTGTQVVNMLAQKKLITQPFWFLLLLRITDNTSKIKAGSYEIPSPISAYQLLKKITDGDAQSSTFQIIEGRGWKEVKYRLARDPNLRHQIKNRSDADIIKMIGATEKHIEGIFFPDTYHYVKGSADIAILKRAYALMQKNVQQAWEARSIDLPLKSPYELLIMASIIEKETGNIADRALVSGVFANRLRAGMRLQTDPTVIYGMGERYKGNIRKVDLLKDTIYNTYTRAGLPPSPIAMPGRAALFAAAQPAKIRARYFVAKGEGSSHFSETLIEHNRAIDKYLRGIKR